jgi:hypothetical protein
MFFYWVGLMALLVCLSLVLRVDYARSAAPTPQIIIAQLKITSGNGQFITLYNNTSNAIDLSTVQLQYFNNYDLLKATSGKLISLSGKVPAHGYVLVSDGPAQICYQMVVDSVSLGLSSTAGMIQVAHFASTSSPQSFSILDDYVGWSKAAVPGAQTLPSSTNSYLQRKPIDSKNAPVVSSVGEGSWEQAAQPDGSSLCAGGSGSVGAGGELLSANSSPPVAAASMAVALPGIDAGLMAPQISELLPNPGSPLSDSTDEFVELYNPNNSEFDLGGFSLQSGITSTHNFIFPDGQFILQPHEFRAFYAPQTSLSLSNSSGQVKFLDPSGNTLSQTDPYGTAKDDYAWVYADNNWQWTTTPTPNSANIINSPPVSKSSAGSSKSSSSKTAAKSAKSSAKPKPSTSLSSPAALVGSTLHPAILAVIGSLALLYALYEYRHDLANTFIKLRRYREARRDHWFET